MYICTTFRKWTHILNRRNRGRLMELEYLGASFSADGARLYGRRSSTSGENDMMRRVMAVLTTCTVALQQLREPLRVSAAPYPLATQCLLGPTSANSRLNTPCVNPNCNLDRENGSSSTISPCDGGARNNGREKGGGATGANAPWISNLSHSVRQPNKATHELRAKSS